jgi:hypothetical protein
MYNINMFRAHEGYMLTELQSTILYLVNLILTRLTQFVVIMVVGAIVTAFVKLVWYGLSI